MSIIFVSSTFRDMNSERDAIRNITAPLLNQKAARYGQDIVFCDLRWGVNTDDLDTDDGAKKVLNICLDEIDRCNPPMVVLLGYRYGWIPSSQLIESAAARKKMQLDDLEKSITALEIEYGALSGKRTARRTLFYFREIINEAPDIFQSEDAAHQKKLDALKARIKKLAGGNINTYRVSWNSKEERLTGIESFAKRLADDIAKKLSPEWRALAALSEAEKELMIHKAFAERKALHLKTRSRLVHLLKEEMMSNGKLILQGAQGVGKTTLVSNIAKLAENEGYETIVLFGGYTPATGDIGGVLKLFCDFLAEKGSPKLNENEKKFRKQAQTEKELATLFELLCKACSPQKTIALFLDAADQLIHTHMLLRLRFLPEELPPNIHICISCTDRFDIGINAAETIRELSSAEITAVAASIAASNNRELGKNVTDALIQKENASNPLYLNLLLQRLIMMDSRDFDRISELGGGMDAINAVQTEIIARCPDGLQELCSYMFDFAGNVIDRELIKDTVALIAMSRRGLRETDLSAILSDRWSSLYFYQFIHFLPESFIVGENGIINFAHKCYREAFRRQIPDSNQLHETLFRHLESLPENDYLRKREAVYHALKSGHTDFVCDYAAAHCRDKALRGYICENILAADPKLDALYSILNEQNVSDNFLIFVNYALRDYINTRRSASDAFHLMVRLYEAIAQIYEELYQADPGNTSACRELWITYDNLGKLYGNFTADQYTEKAKAYREQAELCCLCFASDQSSRDALENLIHNALSCAMFYQKGNARYFDADLAEDYYRDAEESAELLLKKFNRADSYNLAASTYYNHGEFLTSVYEYRTAEAARLFEVAFDYYKHCNSEENLIKLFRDAYKNLSFSYQRSFKELSYRYSQKADGYARQSYLKTRSPKDFIEWLALSAPRICSMIDTGRIEEAKRYAEETDERITVFFDSNQKHRPDSISFTSIYKTLLEAAVVFHNITLEQKYAVLLEKILTGLQKNDGERSSAQHIVLLNFLGTYYAYYCSDDTQRNKANNLFSECEQLIASYSGSEDEKTMNYISDARNAVYRFKEQKKKRGAMKSAFVWGEPTFGNCSPVFNLLDCLKDLDEETYVTSAIKCYRTAKRFKRGHVNIDEARRILVQELKKYVTCLLVATKEESDINRMKAAVEGTYFFYHTLSFATVFGDNEIIPLSNSYIYHMFGINPEKLIAAGACPYHARRIKKVCYPIVKVKKRDFFRYIITSAKINAQWALEGTDGISEVCELFIQLLDNMKK